MKPVDIILIAVLAAIVGFAAWYIYRSKKSGKKCIGCPDGGTCSGHCGGSCGCCSDNADTKRGDH